MNKPTVWSTEWTNKESRCRKENWRKNKKCSKILKNQWKNCSITKKNRRRPKCRKRKKFKTELSTGKKIWRPCMTITSKQTSILGSYRTTSIVCRRFRRFETQRWMRKRRLAKNTERACFWRAFKMSTGKKGENCFSRSTRRRWLRERS